MTINEIKDLTRFLTEDEIKSIKKEIKDKEDVLKSGDIDEEELIEVLNTLFSILVIEKALESKVEEVEDIRDVLEQELLESYNLYDSYLVKCKKEEKKKKKHWLLNFLFLSDKIHSQRVGVNTSKKTIEGLKGEINRLKAEKSEENLKEVVNSKNHDKRERFHRVPRESRYPELKKSVEIINKYAEKRAEALIKGDNIKPEKIKEKKNLEEEKNSEIKYLEKYGQNMWKRH